MKTFTRFVIITILVQIFSLIVTHAQVRSILPDNSFGTAGVVFNNYSAARIILPGGIDTQADGKIVESVGGIFPAVRRFFSNGTLDVDFGVGGYTTLDRYGYGSIAYSVKVLPGGKILVHGANVAHTTFIVRLTSGGAVDSTFGSSGYCVLGTLESPDMKVLSDGSIRVFFYKYCYPYNTAMLIKIKNNGIVDSTFGTSGMVVIMQALGGYGSFTLDHNDRIIMSARIAGGVVATRILPNGSIDGSFGNNGITVFNPSDSRNTTQVPVTSVITTALPDNSIVIVMTHSGVNQFVFAAHLRSDGTMDTSYGQGGLAATGLLNAFAASAIAFDNGEVLLAGSSISKGSTTISQSQLSVLNIAGQVDSVFENHQGYITIQYDTTVGGNRITSPGNIIFLPGNRMLMSGSTKSTLTWLARYNFSGFVTNINEAERSAGLDLYPNPADKYVMIRYQPDRNEDVRLRVYDLLGKILLEKTIPLGRTLYQLESANWNAVIYFVEIKSGCTVSTRKLLVQHSE